MNLVKQNKNLYIYKKPQQPFKKSCLLHLPKREQVMFKLNATLLSPSLFDHLLVLLAKVSYKGVQL